MKAFAAYLLFRGGRCDVCCCVLVRRFGCAIVCCPLMAVTVQFSVLQSPVSAQEVLGNLEIYILSHDSDGELSIHPLCRLSHSSVCFFSLGHHVRVSCTCCRSKFFHQHMGQPWVIFLPFLFLFRLIKLKYINGSSLRAQLFLILWNDVYVSFTPTLRFI